MTPAARLSRLSRHALTFVLHFAHGGFVMAGVMVIGVVGYQLTQYGTEGLNPRSMFGYAKETVREAEPAAEGSIGLIDAVFSEKADNQAKLSANFNRVAVAIAKRHHLSFVVAESLVQAAQHEGQANGVDPLLILAVITVESGFNPFLESGQGAQGLMQIIPKFHLDKISPEKGSVALFDPAENIRVGTLILRIFMNRSDDMETALQGYGGASTDPDMHYANKVLQELGKLQQVAGIPSKGTHTAASRTVSDES